MLSEIIHTPEFASPLPGWTPGAVLALVSLAVATRLMFPAETPAASHEPFGSAEGVHVLTSAEARFVT